MHNALNKAKFENSSMSPSQISIMAPCFWTKADVKAGAARDDVLIWGETTWISGHKNVGPDDISDYSSFKALDALIAYYMNRTAYPNLNVSRIRSSILRHLLTKLVVDRCPRGTFCRSSDGPAICWSEAYGRR